MRILVYPYKMGSKSATAISRSVNAIRIRSVGRYVPRSDDFILNWGNSTVPGWSAALRGVQRLKILNHWDQVRNAANKLSTFRILRTAGIPTPNWTTDRATAEAWRDAGYTIYGRERLVGHSGEGIRITRGRNVPMPTTPLYVNGIENHGEYRVHVFGGRVIDYQKKLRHNGDEPTNAQLAVRNLASGWVYARENLRRLERVETIAISAVSALGLDFGAVDIIKDQNGDVFVLEVNTACGLVGTTLTNYINAINESIHA